MRNRFCGSARGYSFLKLRALISIRLGYDHPIIRSFISMDMHEKHEYISIHVLMNTTVLNETSKEGEYQIHQRKIQKTTDISP